MNKYLNVGLLGGVLLLGGCSAIEKAADTVESLTPSQATLATVAIKAGTIKLILRDTAKEKATAAMIVNIATEASNFLSGGTVTIISDLNTKLVERITELNLSPEKQIIVDMLLAAVKAKIETDITGNVLNANTIVTINGVLNIIKTTAEMYD